MANDKDITIGIKTTADTSGAKEVGKAIDGVNTAGQNLDGGQREWTDNTEAAAEAVAEQAQTLEEAADAVRENLKVVDDLADVQDQATTATKRSTGALGKYVRGLLAAGKASLVGAAAWQAGKVALEGLSRWLKINETAALENAMAQEEAAITAMRASAAKKQAADAAAAAVKAEADEIARLTGLLDAELASIDKSTAAHQRNLNGRNAIIDAELARDIARVNAGGGTEVEKLEQIAALRKKHAEQQQELDRESIEASIKAEQKKEAAARNRLGSLPDAERDRVATPRAQAEAARKEAQRKMETADSLGSAAEGAASNLDNIVFGEDIFAQDRDEFDTADKYIDYVKKRFEGTLIGTGPMQFNPEEYERAEEAIRRFEEIRGKQTSLTKEAEDAKLRAETLDKQAAASADALAAEEKRLKDTIAASDDAITRLREELALKQQLARIRGEGEGFKTSAGIAAAKSRGEKATPSASPEIAKAINKGNLTTAEAAKIGPALQALFTSNAAAFQEVMRIIEGSNKELKARVMALEKHGKYGR